MLKSLISKGLKPSMVTYCMIIGGLCDNGATKKVEGFFYSMISKRPEPNTWIYNTFINGLFHSMLSKGVEPDVTNYSTLMNGFCNNGEIEKAEEMLQTMILKGLMPNVVCYNTYMKGLCNRGFIEKAEEVTKTMISKGLEPDELQDLILLKGQVTLVLIFILVREYF